MDDQWRWVIGLAVSLCLGWGTILIGFGWRFLLALRELEDDLHREINQVRNEYVRRVDLDGHIQRLGEDIKGLRTEIQQGREATNIRLDAVLAALATGPT